MMLYKIAKLPRCYSDTCCYAHKVLIAEAITRLHVATIKSASKARDRLFGQHGQTFLIEGSCCCCFIVFLRQVWVGHIVSFLGIVSSMFVYLSIWHSFGQSNIRLWSRRRYIYK